MSIVWTLRKWVDPVYQEEEEARRRQRETLEVQHEPGDGGRRLDPGRPSGDVEYRCRVCGHQSRDGAFCPHCLAGTMKRIGKPA